jgi:hypothetical protein
MRVAPISKRFTGWGTRVEEALAVRLAEDEESPRPVPDSLAPLDIDLKGG